MGKKGQVTYLWQASHRVEKKPHHQTQKTILIYYLSVVNIYLDAQTGYQIAAYKKVANHSKTFQLNC